MIARVWVMLEILTLWEYGAIFWCDSKKNMIITNCMKMFQRRYSKVILIPTFLTVNFVACNMQQNQINLILLHGAGNKNSYFKASLERSFYVATFSNTFYATFFIQTMILKKKNVLNQKISSYFKDTFHISCKLHIPKTLTFWPLFMDGVQLPQG